MAMSQEGLEMKMVAELEAKDFNLVNSGWMQDFLHAISKAIIDEIVANSELVPVTTDSGIAGSGIITGKVK